MSMYHLYEVGIAFISVSICASVIFNTSNEHKLYYKLAQTLFMAIILFYGLISIAAMTSIQEFVNIIVTMVLVLSILIYKKQSSDQVFLVSFLSAALLFGLQANFNQFQHKDNINKETILSLMINIKNDFIGSDLNKMTAQIEKNYELMHNFTEYMKYKETVCSLISDNTEKTAKLVLFNMDHQKDALEYKHGIKTLSELVYGMSEKMSSLKKEDDKKLYNLQQKRMKNIREFEDKISDFINNFDVCSYKNTLKSNTLFDESEKAQKTVDELRKEAESIIFVDYK